MRSVTKNAIWFYHTCIVGTVLYELLTIETTEIVIGNWVLVFSAVGLAVTLLSSMLLSFELSKRITFYALNFLLKKRDKE